VVYLGWSDCFICVFDVVLCLKVVVVGVICLDLYELFKGVDGSIDFILLFVDDGDYLNVVGYAFIVWFMFA